MDGAAAGRRSADGDLFAHRRAARQPGGRLAIATAPPTACCGPEHRDRTFVILATSHYGEPEKFGLTRKNFRTPLGEAPTDTRAGGLAGGARRRAASRWKITATPSSTPWNCR